MLIYIPLVEPGILSFEQHDIAVYELPKSNFEFMINIIAPLRPTLVL